MSIMNYNDWFHKYHAYLKGTRGNITSYNDTKWNTISERYDALVNLMSGLLDEQPFNVVGNYTGFQQLTELMEQSNYTYEDIDASLVETYRQTLQDAMSRMLVNTHCVVANYRFDDKRNVSHDKYGHYYIIDIPYDQLHFGERDEFVRQKLHAFYETESEYYMPSDRFLSNEISKILGFTVICCVNGMMSDDWSVGISEQGFRFKIGWKYSSDATFTIYKLDESDVYDVVIPIPAAKSYMKTSLPYANMNLSDQHLLEGRRCIVQIMDNKINKNTLVVPNFGVFGKNGLQINNIQQKTLNDLDLYQTSSVKFRIYVIKYLREIPGIYPAVNYYDMMDTKLVYTENGSHVMTKDGKRVILQNIHSEEKLPICTPPISLSHVSANVSAHTTIRLAHDIINELNQTIPTVQTLWTAARTYNPPLKPGEIPSDYYQTNVLNVSDNLYRILTTLASRYTEAAILTSLIPVNNINMFENMLEFFNSLRSCNPDWYSIQSVITDMIEPDNYKTFVTSVTEPLNQPPFTTMGVIEYPNYFNNNLDPVNRPVAEQCFIALKYNADEDMQCWVFDVPKLKHFQGIDNVFYVDNNLTGKEIYKFMYLYTDTENPSEKNRIENPKRFSMDFDIFTKEIDKHMGYIRYWDATNRLFKLANMYYSKDDPSYQLAILTKVLKKKLDGDVFLEYASDVNYELSNVSSDNIRGYDEHSQRAPFSINFLFYTLSLYRGHKNRMQSYLMHMITNKKFYPRYADLKVSELTTDLLKEPINYSVISHSPVTLRVEDQSISNLPDTSDITLYAGLMFPVRTADFLPVNPDVGLIRYPYVFNTYKPNRKYHMMTEHNLDQTHYIQYTNPRHEMGDHPETKYFYDAQLASMLTVYLSEVYNGINDLVTNYASRWDQTTTINSLKDVIERHTEKIQTFLNLYAEDDQFYAQGFDDVLRHFSGTVSSNPIYILLNQIQSRTNNMKGLIIDQSNRQYVNLFKLNQILLTDIRKIHEQCGFNRNAVGRIRRLYIQMKRLNQFMNLEDYCEWLNHSDEFLFISGMNGHKSLIDFYSDNKANAPYSDTKIRTDITNFLASVNMAKLYCNGMQTTLNRLIHGDVQTEYIDQLVAYCDDVIQNHTYNFYTMNPISFDKELAVKPTYAEVLISDTASHVAWDIETYETDTTFAITTNVVFDQSENGYKITELIPTCAYAFLDGEPLQVSIRLMDASGELIELCENILITFTKIGNSGDIHSETMRYVPMQTIPLEVQNIHETFDTNLSGDIINKRHANLHYELLCGNHFTPLDYTSEYCSPPKDDIQGPIDKLYLSCDRLNYLSLIDETNRPKSEMYFRACDVFHITPIDDTVTSIGGKYFVGQKVYAITDDKQYIFPMIITSIDHSQQRGMIEAKVDLQHTKWFKTTDSEMMHKYLTENIICTIVDDNIRNFLDEYSNSSYAPYITDTMMQEHLVYIGNGAVVTDDSDDNFIIVNMINHNFNPYSLPELYNVLRTEPDDHHIWDQEIKVFKSEGMRAFLNMTGYAKKINQEYEKLKTATTDEERMEIRMKIDDYECKRKYAEEHMKRMDSYIAQLETPTTWYNIRAYDDALVYINNGRAHLSRTFHPHVQDLSYTDAIDVLLYDWERKVWIDKQKYTIETVVENNIAIDPVDDFLTDNVLTTLKITFNDPSFKSKKILIYFGYEQSDVFDNIQMNDMNCEVRFQPVLITQDFTDQETVDPYSKIRIRKHYDENEKYTITKLKPLPETFGMHRGFIFDRPNRSGLYTNGSPIRFCDMTIQVGNITYGLNDVDIYIPYPMQDTTVQHVHRELVYTVSLNHLNNPLVNGQKVTLMSVDNHSDAMFHITASNVLFEGIVADDQIVITSSNLPSTTTNVFTCTILQNKHHTMFGGVITIQVQSVPTDYETIPGWFHLNGVRSDIMHIGYRLIPESVAIVMRDDDTLDTTVTVTLQNHYELDTSHDVSSNNDNTDDLFTYYYDKEYDVRYPIGHVYDNDQNHRLTIDRTMNPSVETIRSNHIGVCRYTVQKIPSDGIIDLTGYIPTPLTRDRYEFWVNGRYISDPEDIVIMSPTIVQLRNLTSLKNLDIVELIDDPLNNIINKRDAIYVDIGGKTYTSFLEMLAHRGNISNQSIQYVFNQDINSDFDSYIIDTMRRPNNNDYEPDIMKYITTDDAASYTMLNNLPTINGETILNLQTSDLGLMEIPNSDILSKFDRVWKYEGLNGITPFKHLARYVDTRGTNQTIHVHELEDYYEIFFTGLSDLCFTLYIANHSVDQISDRNNVIQIIPMIKPGTRILIQKSFKGKWIHTTIPTSKPIHL